MIPLVGFLPADDPRVHRHGGGDRARADVRWLRPALPTPKEHIDGLPPGEGAFLACTFWLADNYVLQGRRDDARQLFERLARALQRRRPAGRAVRPESGQPLGNFPQAFSHVMLINTARNLARVQGPAEERKK